MPASAKRGYQPQGRQGNAADILGGIAQKLKERGEQMQEQQGDDEEVEDLNILPFPNSQNIYGNNGTIVWEWIVNEEVTVTAVLYTKDDTPEGGNTGFKKGDYNIVQHTCDDSGENDWTPEDAKILGQALISASNWKNIWRDHAGKFIAQELG